MEADKAGRHVERFCIICWKKESANLARHLKTHTKSEAERKQILQKCSEHTPSGVRTCSFDEMPQSVKELWLDGTSRKQLLDFFQKKLGVEIVMDANQTVS
jgi:hypothetical protein